MKSTDLDFTHVPVSKPFSNKDNECPVCNKALPMDMTIVIEQSKDYMTMYHLYCYSKREVAATKEKIDE